MDKVITVGTKRPPVEVRTIPRDPGSLPKLPPATVDGLVRSGGTMMLSGGPKTCKTVLLMHMATAVAVGMPWLDFETRQARVLYVNTETAGPVFLRKFWDARDGYLSRYDGFDIEATLRNIDAVTLQPSLRDAGSALAKLAADLEGRSYDVIIIDSLYRLQPLPENDPEAIARLCVQLDRLARAFGATLVYSHHHCKGDQGRRNPEERAAGSSVFARHADTIVDLTELEPDRSATAARDRMKEYDARPYRMEIVSRDFAPMQPIDIWHNYPRCWLDGGSLSDCEPRKPGPR